MKRIVTDKAPAALGPYVQAVDTGSTVYCSGQLGLDPVTNTLADGVAAQTRQSLANLAAVLGEALADPLGASRRKERREYAVSELDLKMVGMRYADEMNRILEA